MLVFDIALKSTEMASCFHPAQPHVNTLSTPGLITLSVYATLTQICLCSFVRCRGNEYKYFKRDNNSGINLNF